MGQLKTDFKPRSWSFSALHSYENCALQFLLQRTEPVEQAPSWALEHGLACHTLMENFLKGLITGMPPELKVFENELNRLKENGALAEEELVLDRHWDKVEGDGAWRSKDAWIRAKLDARLDNLIVDLKTGREYPHYAEQGELYATMLMQVDRTINAIDVEFWYTKSGEVASFSFSRDDHDERVEMWEARVRKLMNEKHWLPKINIGCRWCAYQERCEIYDG